MSAAVLRIRSVAAARLPRSSAARTALIVVCLALAGLAIRQAWWSPLPLSAGDWHWWGSGRLQQWFPWPSIWDQTLGFSGQNRFEDAFRYPIYALTGLIGALGGGWALAEKVAYFIPFAVLLPVSGWLFAREIMGRTRWALLAPLLLVASTYLILESNVHVPLTIAEAVGLLALTTFLRTMRLLSVRWALVTGLLMAVAMVFDARPAYLTGLLMGLYLLVLALADRGWRRLARRVLLTAAAGALFAVIQSYWLIPLLAYGHSPHFPTPAAPDFNVLTLDHGITGVSDFWTGGPEALLVEAPLNPAFMILPLIAFIPLLRRRVRAEVLWLVVAAVVAAFVAKTDNPPLGGLYDWMYLHIPGWRLFREGSKFLYVVVAAYSVLVPLAAQQLTGAAARSRPRWRPTLRAAAALPAVAVVALCASVIAVLETGILDSTTHPTAEPASFSQLNAMLTADSRAGAVMWFGEPVVLGGADRNHRFVFASAQHSVAYMTGTLTENQVHHRDVFQYFCGDSYQPFCYLENGVFQYLANLNGAAYAVAPGGNGTGVLPRGITRSWIRKQLTGMYGAPQQVGTGDDSLLVWRLPAVGAAARSAAAVGFVESGPWSLPSVLPALQALGVPAVYQQSLDTADYPPATTPPADSIAVMPRWDSACHPGSAGPLTVLASTGAAHVTAKVSGTAMTLPRLAQPTGTPGWSLYGPIDAPAGALSIQAGATALGPCVAWTPLTAAVIATPAAQAPTATVTAQGEHISASLSGAAGAWTELARSYDPGWRLGGAGPTAVGDYLDNLYYTGPGAKAARGIHGQTLAFQFSTLTAEHVGLAVGAVVTLAALVLVVVLWRRERRRGATAALEDVAPPVFTSPAAPYVAGLGLLMLAVAAAARAAEWFGLPSRVTGVALASDPYRLDVGYDTAAIILIIASSMLFVLGRVLRRRSAAARVTEPEAARPPLVAASLLCIVLVVGVSACGTSAPSNPSAALEEAQTAGETSAFVTAASLDEARVQRQARNPGACIADYTQALTGFPDLPSAYSGRAGCYMSSNDDSPAAVHDYSRAIALSPESTLLHLRRAAAELASGDVSSAAADYLHAAAIPSTNASEFLVAVDGLLALGDITDAQVALNQGRGLFPNSGVVDLAAARVDVALGDDTGALAEDTAALPLLTTDSDRARLYNERCRFHLLRHNYEQAATECRQALRYNLDSSGAYDDLSVAELAMGDISAAIDAESSAINAFTGNVNPQAQPSGVNGFGLALLYEARAREEVQAGRIAAAVADLSHALRALPPATPDLAARLKGELESIR